MFMELLFLPRTIFKGLFFYSEIQDGVVVRVRFSSSRTMFVLGSLAVIARMFLGGMEVKGLKLGPEISIANSINTEQVSKRNGYVKIKTRAKYYPKKTTESKKTRAWMHIQDVKFYPLQMWEVVGLLVFALLFFFSKDIEAGSKKGSFSGILNRLTTAGERKISGDKNYKPTSEPIVTEEIDDDTPEPEGIKIPSGLDRRPRKKKTKPDLF